MSPEDFKKDNVQVFNEDVSSHGGYVYTTSQGLSCRLATQRSIDAILETNCIRDRSVIDLGCGDGFYTIKWWDLQRPRSLLGIDPAVEAIAVANKNKGNREVVFQVEDAHHLPFANDQFEVALVQSILHHDDNPKEVIREAFRVAPTILIHEPNGNNPGLKLIERLSPYHRLHDEKSYTSVQLKRWIRECGGEVIHERFAGFVPMFSPEWLASMMKTFEPLVENTPLVRTVGCAVIVIVARRVTSPA